MEQPETNGIELSSAGSIVVVVVVVNGANFRATARRFELANQIKIARAPAEFRRSRHAVVRDTATSFFGATPDGI